MPETCIMPGLTPANLLANILFHPMGHPVEGNKTNKTNKTGNKTPDKSAKRLNKTYKTNNAYREVFLPFLLLYMSYMTFMTYLIKSNIYIMSYFLNKTYKTFWGVLRNTILPIRVTHGMLLAENFPGREKFFWSIGTFFSASRENRFLAWLLA